MSVPLSRYINPLTDFGFKKLFGTEPNKDLLIDFLNQVLPEQHQVADLSYSATEHLGLRLVDRKAVFDLYCISESGEHFIVELQKAKQNYFRDRSVFYASFPIQEQAQRGEWDFELQPVYTIGILDFVFADHKDDDELYHLVELKDQNCQVFYDKLKFIYLELPKFKKTEEELETQFDRWLYVFRYLSELQERPAALQNRIFARLFEAAEIAQFTPDERRAYQASLKYYRDINNIVDTARQEGVEQGIEQGIEQGVERGREQAQFDFARRLKADGVPTEDIARYTGLDEDQIKALR